MKKALKIIIRVIAAILCAVLIVAALLFFPLRGEEHVEVWAPSEVFDIGAVQTVEKTPGKPFHLLVLADTQLWMSPSQNENCYEQVKALVEKTAPDLIVLVGDNVSGVTSRFLLPQLIKVLDSFKIPWAPVFGNHDPEIPTTTLNWQGDKYMESIYCLFQKGPSNLYGCGNYVVNITENGKPIQSLFLMDNGRYLDYGNGVTKEIYMDYAQIAWYEWNVKGIAEAGGTAVPSMVFTHFSPPQMRTAVETLCDHDEAAGIYKVKSKDGFGSCVYLPSCAPVDSGFFAKCKELGSTKHMFFGHDHENNASITYEGITMTYVMKTGLSPKPWNNAEQMGGTLVTIDNAANGYPVTLEHIPLT